MKENPIELSQIVNTLEKKVNTKSLDISLNELADMVEEKELKLDPDFQRVFQWGEEARSRFIESLLLELPVPPIYAIEEASGSYLLVDGLQRLSSYLHFRGQLSAPQFNPPVHMGEFLTLNGCDIVEELNGLTYNDLPTDLQIRIKRAFMRFEVIRNNNDNNIKYYMFKRLNSGGIPLSDQQKRNASIRMLDQRFIGFISRLAENEHFITTIEPISEEKTLSWYNIELVLRYFAMKNWRDRFKHDIREFLDEYAEYVAKGDASGNTVFDYESEEQNFKDTFSMLSEAMGEKVFGFKTRKTNQISGFSVMQFEAITLGIQDSLNTLKSMTGDARIEVLSSFLGQVKFDETYISLTAGGGRNSAGPFNRRIDYISDSLRAILSVTLSG